MKPFSFISILLCVLIAAAALTGCGKGEPAAPEKETGSAAETSAEAESIDYMVLVNKNHALPGDWEERIETVTMTNSIGDEVEVEKKAYDAYQKLKEALEAEKIHVDLDSARRSVKEQQRIMDDFTEKYGGDYAQKTVAAPGYSEHHTGLALDLYLIIDGKDIVENEDMIQYPEIWSSIHEKLADYGFILRYLKDKEHITGYSYEPWHIRYIDSADTAAAITSKGQTLEEYLGAASGAEVDIDHGTSEIFDQNELNEAVIQIKCRFAALEGFELKSIRYAGDEFADAEGYPEGDYAHTAVFLMSFSTPKDTEASGFDPDKDYIDYQCVLEYSRDGEWDIVSF